MKKALLIILSAIMILSIVPLTASAATYGNCGENLTILKSIVATGIEILEAHNFDFEIMNTEVSSVSLKKSEVPETTEHVCTWSSWAATKAPTCQAEGVKMRNCTVCGEAETEAIAKVDCRCKWVVTKEATATEYGEKALKCIYCGDIKEIVKLPPKTGGSGDDTTTDDSFCNYHTWSNWSIQEEATCKTDGTMVRSCMICGESETETILATGTCVYGSFYENLTCISDGIKYDECIYCGDRINETILPASGHNYEAYVNAPTCTEKGFTTYTCASCNDIVIDNYEEATGHKDNDGDGYCDMDNELLDPSVECEHNCHKTGISGFFWKISNFFNKLFRTKQYCECGVAHY